WEYDTLSVVKPGQSLVAWAVNVRIRLQKLLANQRFNGSARLIQKAYRNYRKRPVLLAKQVWEAVRNDNTPREKKFLSMPSRDTRCTVNLDIWYSIDGLYRPFNIPLDQFYDYISYSKHK
ncbi:20489_t:CDS:2, partial [Rhizophagus irregularis]